MIENIRVAICLLGVDEETTEKKVNILKDCKYDLEFWKQSDKSLGIYNTYSQVINEAICETSSEFIIFINPKSQIQVDNIDEIITKLCSGYGIVTLIGFGFWGATKELFREVGLLDERFIGGGWEDVDFLLRVRIKDIAMYIGHRYEKYIGGYGCDGKSNSLFSTNRGLGRGVFNNKWLRKEINGHIFLVLNKNFANEKKVNMNVLLKNKKYIKRSWLSFSDSVEEETSISRYTPFITIKGYSGFISGLKSKVKIIEGILDIDYKGDTFWIKISTSELINNQKIVGSCQLISTKNNLAMHDRLDFYLNTNTYINSERLHIKGDASLSVFQGGDKIYMNYLIKPGFKCKIPVSLKYYELV